MAKLGKLTNLFKLPGSNKLSDKNNGATQAGETLTIQHGNPPSGGAPVSAIGGTSGHNESAGSAVSSGAHTLESSEPTSAAGAAVLSEGNAVSLSPGISTVGSTIIPRPQPAYTSHPSSGSSSVGSALSSGGAGLTGNTSSSAPEAGSALASAGNTLEISHPSSQPSSTAGSAAASNAGALEASQQTAAAGSAVATGAAGLSSTAATDTAQAAQFQAQANEFSTQAQQDQAAAATAQGLATQDQATATQDLAGAQAAETDYNAQKTNSTFWHTQAWTAGANLEGAQNHEQALEGQLATDRANHASAGTISNVEFDIQTSKNNQQIYAGEQNTFNAAAAPYDQQMTADETTAVQDQMAANGLNAQAQQYSAQAQQDTTAANQAQAQAAEYQNKANQAAAGFPSSSSYNNLPGTQASAVHNNAAAAGGAVAMQPPGDIVNELAGNPNAGKK